MHVIVYIHEQSNFHLFHLACKVIKKTLYIIGLTFLTASLSMLMVYGVFRTSFVQTRLAGMVTGYLSKELGTEVSVKGLDISWFLNIELIGVTIKDLKDQNILKSDKIKIRFGKINFRRRFVGIYAITLDHAEVNLILYKSDGQMNYNFITDYFTFSDTLQVKKPSKPSKPWKIGFSGVKLINTSFTYCNELEDSIAVGVDYNHLALKNIELEIRKVKIDGDSITGIIKHLGFAEKSGFVLNSLTAEVKVKSDSIVARNLLIETPDSHLALDLKFIHKNFGAYNYFIDSVKMDASFNQSSLMLADIGYFAPALLPLREILKIDGHVKGTVSSLKAQRLRFALGKSTYFEGNVNMDGLPDIEETFIHLNIKDLRTNFDDISNFKSDGKKLLELPEVLKNLGNIRVKGFFTGFFYDFVSAATFTTSTGTLKTDLSLKTSAKNNVNFQGHVNLLNWDLGKTLNASKYLGKIDLSTETTGNYNKQSGVSAVLAGTIGKLELMRNEFNDIKLDGKFEERQFNGSLSLRDELIDLDFKGLVDFSDKVPAFNFTSTVKNAYLTRLNLWDRDSTSMLSTNMDLNFSGSNIDNLLGSLKFSNTLYSELGNEYPAKNIAIYSRLTSDNSKELSLESDFADINFTGKFEFNDFYSSLINIINNYLPSFRPLPATELIVKQEHIFDYSIRIKDATALTELFLPALKISATADFFGSYNSVSQTILLNGQADQFEIAGISINNWFIKGQNTGSSLKIETGSSAIKFTQAANEEAIALGLENFSLVAQMQGDSITYLVDWHDDVSGKRNFGNIGGYLSFNEKPYIRSVIQKADFAINDTTFTVSQEGDFIIDSTSVAIRKLHIVGMNQGLTIDGKISEDPTDILFLNFKDLNVSNADLLLAQDGLDFDGILNGNITINDLYKERKIQADISIDDFAFNKEKLGDFVILTKWDNQKSGLDINADIVYQGNVGTHKPISVKGYIYPDGKAKDNFDLDISLSNFTLATLNPFLKGFASGLKGYTSGQLRLEGPFNKPAFTGSLQLLRTQFKVDYLNVTYSLADKAEITPGLISAKSILVYDSLGNTGLCDFTLTHDYFRNMRMNLTVQANNLAGLHTTLKDNNLFYGNAVATGNINISGPFEDLKMDINVSTNKGTNIYIPINLDVQATENKYIRFVSAKDSLDDGQTYVPETSGVNLDMQIDVTKDAGLQIFLPEDIGNIKANGSGKIRMGVDTRGDVTAFGTYYIDDGTFLFTFENIINRLFSIERGSTISFNGSPYDADLNVSAVYKLRASVSGIAELASNQEYAGRNVPVDCIIHLKNNLYNPDIAFSIRIPDTEENLKQLIFAAIDTTNDALMTQQMVSLLLMKSFSFTGNAGLAGSVGSSTAEMLTSQLSGMLSQLSKDVDIGLNYRTGDALSSEALEVALSTHLFEDRVTIEGNFGLINTGTTQDASNLVGDVVVDVKITRDGRFRVKAYNKSNNPFERTSYNADYKQGVGIYYRYEFDKFSEIIRRKRKVQPEIETVKPGI